MCDDISHQNVYSINGNRHVKYFNVYFLIDRTLDELKKPQVADERILRFFRYLQAARTGQDGGDCLQKYPTCAQDTTKLSHKPIIDAFYKVSDLMNHDKQ